MFSWLRTLARRHSTPIHKNSRLKIEQLEERLVPAYVPPPAAGIFLSGSQIRIIGDSQDNVASVTQSGTQINVTLGHRVPVYGGYFMTVIDFSKTYTTAQVTDIYFSGSGGDDSFTNDTAYASLGYGGSGNDTMLGGTGADTFYGQIGDDDLQGRNGNDFLYGDDGDDSLDGGSGVDALYGGDDNDYLLGGIGNDSLYGDNGNDSLQGDTGNDALAGGAGNDEYRFSGGALGSDAITEAADLDTDTLNFQPFSYAVNIDLASTSAQSTYSGGVLQLSFTLSNNTAIENVTGSIYADTLRGNTRDNVLSGINGSDTFNLSTGGLGADTFIGGTGNDKYLFKNASFQGSVKIVEDAGMETDTLDFSQLTEGVRIDLATTAYQSVGNGPGTWCGIMLSNVSAIENVIGTNLADDIKGNSRINNITGNSGNDRLWAYGGGDTIHGNNGDDSLYAASGQNYLYGDDGKDTFVDVGGDMQDLLYGGDDLDFFWINHESSGQLPDQTAAEANNVHRIYGFATLHNPDGSQSVTRNLIGQDLIDPELDGGGATGWVNFTEYAERYTLFATNGPTADDVYQGGLGDCYFLAALSAFADVTPDRIRNLVVDLGDGTFAVDFGNESLLPHSFVRVDGDLPKVSGSTLAYAGLGLEKSLWVPIVEKAWAFYRNNEGTYASIVGGGNPGIAVDTALHVDSDSYPSWLYPNGMMMLWGIQAALNAGDAVVVGGPAPLLGNTPLDDDTYQNGAHVYMVDHVNFDANGMPISVTLRNPWGGDGDGGMFDGVSDGYVTISAETLIYCSKGFRAYHV